MDVHRAMLPQQGAPSRADAKLRNRRRISAPPHLDEAENVAQGRRLVRSQRKDMSSETDEAALRAPDVRRQPMSVTRQMAASLPNLRTIAHQKGLKIHHLGAGYPHPEVTDPRSFLTHKAAYFEHLRRAEGINDPTALPEFLRESYAYTDTLGPKPPRQAFSAVYGADWQLAIDPERLIPTVGATGGISLACSLFERPGKPIAYITDAPTYAGFLARAQLNRHAQIF